MEPDGPRPSLETLIRALGPTGFRGVAFGACAVLAVWLVFALSIAQGGAPLGPLAVLVLPTATLVAFLGGTGTGLACAAIEVQLARWPLLAGACAVCAVCVVGVATAAQLDYLRAAAWGGMGFGVESAGWVLERLRAGEPLLVAPVLGAALPFGPLIHGRLRRLHRERILASGVAILALEGALGVLAQGRLGPPWLLSGLLPVTYGVEAFEWVDEWTARWFSGRARPE